MTTRILLYASWAVSLLATMGSLYASEILKFPPCVLCWYQRIAMYPLTVILLVGILIKDKYLPLYVLPLSIVGGLIALFHYLLQRGVVPESVGPCVLGISCTRTYVEWFGFVTIPLLSMLAFVFITLSMIVVLRYNSSLWRKK